MTYKKTVHMDPKHQIGNQAEHLAKSYLVGLGYYIYTKDFGPIDFIAFNPETEETWYIDVKVVSYRSDGTVISRSRPKDFKKTRIDILNVDIERNKIWFNPGKGGITPIKRNIIKERKNMTTWKDKRIAAMNRKIKANNFINDNPYIEEYVKVSESKAKSKKEYKQEDKCDQTIFN